MSRVEFHRTDANAAEIFRALEQAGASVHRGGPLDAIVGFRSKNYLVEVKTARGKLRASQKAFIRAWAGQVAVVRSVDEGLALIGCEVTRA